MNELIDDPQAVLHDALPALENAPCDPWLINATCDDEEGLNGWPNRRVGTRYCSNNRPGVVRRFNFCRLQQASLDQPSPFYGAR